MIFSIFAGYAIQDLVRSRSARKLVLYGLVASLVLLNRRFWFVPFNYEPNLIVYNVKCAITILVLYAVVYFGDRGLVALQHRGEA